MPLIARQTYPSRSSLRNSCRTISIVVSDGSTEITTPVALPAPDRKRPKRERRILTDEQFQVLVGAVAPDVRLMIVVAVTTGMRISEILALKWKCVDLDGSTVRVEKRYYRGDTDEPKTEGSKQRLPLGARWLSLYANVDLPTLTRTDTCSTATVLP